MNNNVKKSNTNRLKLGLSLIGAASLLAVSGMTQAEDNPWYVGVSINQSDIGDIDSISTSPVAGVNRTIDIQSDDDTGFGIKVGKVIYTSGGGDELSVELSYSDVDNDLEDLQFNGVDFSADAGTAVGEVQAETILVRATYAFETGLIDPYIGIGLGSSDLEVEAAYGGSVNAAIGTQPPFAVGSDNAFAFQFRAGLEWDITEQLGAFIEYTYTDVDDVEFSRTGGGPGGLATTTQETDFDIDSINIGLNFQF